VPDPPRDLSGGVSVLRVLHVQKVKGIGGSERHLLALLPALRGRGIEVGMVVVATGDSMRFVQPLRETGIEPRILPAHGDLDLRLTPKLRTEIRAFGATLVHTHLVHADVYGQPAARLSGVPGVSTFHNMSPLLSRRPYRTAAVAAGRLARRSIAISEAVRRAVESLAIPRRGTVRVIPYGIDVEGRRLTPAARAAARARLGLREDDVAVTVAARLIRGKGHDVLIDAIGAALPQAPSLTLLIAGDGPERSALERLTRSLPQDRARFLGFVEDTRELIGASDVVAFPTLPSLGEGFGLTALEAMAAGVPVVASDTGALPEVVDDGRTGIVVPAGSSFALAATLTRLARNPAERERLGAAGLDRARADFSLAAMADRTIAVYEEALAV
jgi:glycosyltransferase involved in cell wall biosynthesis